jgi:hypothetical protein
MLGQAVYRSLKKWSPVLAKANGVFGGKGEEGFDDFQEVTDSRAARLSFASG